MDTKGIFYTIKLLGLIFAISFILDKIVYYALTGMSNKVHTGQGIGKLNHYLKLKDTANIIIFGSSRANRHFVSEEISESAYNIGMDGRKVAYPATLIQLLPKNREQLVIFHIDISYVLDQSYKGEDLDALNTKYHREPIISDALKKYKQDNPFQNIYWSIDYNGFIVGILYNYLLPRYDHTKYKGYDPNYITENQQANLKRIISKTNLEKECDENFVISEISKDLFKQVSDFCNKNNKRLIFVTSPEYHDHCKEDNDVLRDYMKSNGYIYYDYTDLFKEKNDTKYWKDLSHMSDDGAKIFTRQFVKDVLN